MDVYLVTIQDPDEGSCLSWHKTKKDAENKRKEAINNGESVDEVEKVKIPVGKKDMFIQWLNIYFIRDNG